VGGEKLQRRVWGISEANKVIKICYRDEKQKRGGRVWGYKKVGGRIKVSEGQSRYRSRKFTTYLTKEGRWGGKGVKNAAKSHAKISAARKKRVKNKHRLHDCSEIMRKGLEWG